MLCPEVLNFKAPEFTFTTQKRNFNEDHHLNTVKNFAYSHLVSVVLPETLKVPVSLTEVLSKDCDYYKLNNVKLSELIGKNFLSNFVNCGSLYLLSVGTRIDCDNCVCITPIGQLTLNLTKSTYQSLGLEGKVSHFHATSKDRYTVTIDLKQKHFKPGKAKYERTKTCLEKLRFNVLISWEPPNEEICPSSVAKYFYDLGYNLEQFEIKHKSHIIYSVGLPTIEDNNHREFVEWLGMVMVEGNLRDGGPDNYVSTYEPPEPNEKVGMVKCLQWRGFFTQNQLIRFYEKLSEFKNSCDWVAMYVQGFSDSPIAWKAEEHHYYTNGDNSYTFILTKEYLISCIQKCSRKRYNNKSRGKPL